jgi:hypothetical protein
LANLSKYLLFKNANYNFFKLSILQGLAAKKSEFCLPEFALEKIVLGEYTWLIISIWTKILGKTW